MMRRSCSIEINIGSAYDVVVCGGGTAGCMAAIAAARAGAKTLLIERSFSVGGMLTVGNAGITKYTVHYTDAKEYREQVLRRLGSEPEAVQIVGGIPREYVERMAQRGGALMTSGHAGSYVFTDRYESQFMMMDMLEEAGVKVVYDSKVCQVSMEGMTITGVVVYNKSGFTEYPAKRVIDCTGDADVAVMAGADYVVGVTESDIEEGCGEFVGQVLHNGSMFRVRGVDRKALLSYLEEHPEKFIMHDFGVMMQDDVAESEARGEVAVYRMWLELPGGERIPMQVYNAPAEDEVVLLPGNQRIYVDGLDAEAVSDAQGILWKNIRESLAYLKRTIPGFEQARFSYIPDIGIRETRRVIGDYSLSGRDLLEGTEFSDAIGFGGHPVDIKPLRQDILDHHYNNWRFSMPYRIMLPKGVENLLVAGRSVSASRMASGSIRPTVQCMVLGEAAGTAAAISVEDGTTCREVDVNKLRERLRTNGVVL